MTTSFDRQSALELLEDNLSNRNLIRHCLATEAVMRKLAENRGEDPDLWGVTGLLHDLDYEETENAPDRHGLIGADALQGKLPEKYLHAIRAHNHENNGVERVSDLDHLLAAGESITGLIVAVALVYPGKQLQPVKLKSVLKRMNMSAFARSVSRETIRECSLAGYSLEEFGALCLEAMKGIASDIGL